MASDTNAAKFADTGAAVASTLEHYARRGVLRAVGGARSVDGSHHEFRFTWFHNRTFDLIVDPSAAALRVPVVLPEVSRQSSIYAALRRHLTFRRARTRPAHRRIDVARCAVTCVNRGNAAGISIKVLDGDFAHATRQLVQVLSEIFLVLLRDGVHRRYMMEVWELDPDTDQF